MKAAPSEPTFRGRLPGKEEPFWGQVKYLMHFGVRKLRVFLGFYFTDSLKPDKKITLSADTCIYKNF